MERVIRLNRQEDSDKIWLSTTDFARRMKISNAKIFSCSLQSLDFFAKYLSQIISDIVVPISYPNLLWTRRQDLAIGFVHTIWVQAYAPTWSQLNTHLWSGEAWVALWSSYSKRSLGICKATSQRFLGQGSKDKLKVFYTFQDRRIQSNT